jgi:hypothetical protein
MKDLIKYFDEGNNVQEISKLIDTIKSPALNTV